LRAILPVYFANIFPSMRSTGANVVRIEAEALRALAERIAGPMAGAFERVVELLHGCAGRVVVTGMGKSGLVARKLAATLSSTGTPSLFLHPAEAVHGDLGMLVRGDVVIALSQSGETEEIVRLLANIKRLQVPLITFTGDKLFGSMSSSTGSPKTEDDDAQRALFDLEPLVGGKGITSTEAVDHLRRLPFWRNYRSDGLNATLLGNLLGRLGLHSKPIRFGKGVARGYTPDSVNRVIEPLRIVRAEPARLSTLAQAAEVALDCSVAQEACSLGLSPTASTTTMLALGDALAVALAEKRGFKEEDFADLHPGGKLGKKLARVSSLMHSGDALPRVVPQTRMSEVIYEMSRKGLGMTTVVEGERLVGIISDGDLRRLLERHSRSERKDDKDVLALTAGDCMTRTPKTIGPDAFAAAALDLMEQRKITSLAVIDGDARLLGVVHLHDLWGTEMM